MERLNLVESWQQIFPQAYFRFFSMFNSLFGTNRQKFTLLLGAIFLPPLIALIAYLIYPSVFTANVTDNQLSRIEPGESIDPFTNLKLDGTEVTLETLKSKWTMVFRFDGECSEICQTTLKNSRRAKLAMNHNSERIQRILLGGNVNHMESAAEGHPDLGLVLRVLGGLNEQLNTVVKKYNLEPYDALLIDPAGRVNWVIPATIAPTSLFKNMKKILENSEQI